MHNFCKPPRSHPIFNDSISNPLSGILSSEEIESKKRTRTIDVRARSLFGHKTFTRTRMEMHFSLLLPTLLENYSIQTPTFSPYFQRSTLQTFALNCSKNVKGGSEVFAQFLQTMKLSPSFQRFNLQISALDFQGKYRSENCICLGVRVRVFFRHKTLTWTLMGMHLSFSLHCLLENSSPTALFTFPALPEP